MQEGRGLGWLGIVRLGLVQTAIGAVVVLATSTLNRVMVVDFQLAATLPAGLVAWHYAVQLSRPRWGHAADRGGKRTHWVIVGMGVLALGAVIATDGAILAAHSWWWGLLLGVVGFTLIGAGVGAAGTSLLALLSARVAAQRRPAAAAITWIMMIFGLAATAGVVGAVLDPFSPQRLALVVSAVAGGAFLLAVLAVLGMEGPPVRDARSAAPAGRFADAVGEIWADRDARAFTLFVLIAMLAYSMQDLILEPFAGLRFVKSVGESTSLAGLQQAGVLLGMIATAAAGSRAGGGGAAWRRWWTAAGCVGSAAALAGLAVGSFVGPGWPLAANVFGLGLCNGVFAVAAIGAMMGLASAGPRNDQGARMGVFGAAQAVGFGVGGVLGAAGVDLLRSGAGEDAAAFSIVFGVEAGLFLAAAVMAWRLALPAEPHRNLAADARLARRAESAA